jgi:hypothetical protein
MQIFVRMGSGRVITLDVEPTDTIQNLKGKIQDQTAILPADQTLVFDGRLLEENRTLGDYNIQREDMLELVLVSDTTTTTTAASTTTTTAVVASTTAVGAGGGSLPHSGAGADLSAVGLVLVVIGGVVIRAVRRPA